MKKNYGIEKNELEKSLSTQVGLEFDSRPGLKFLVQKVAQLNNAANLYKQAGAAWSLTAITLFDLCLARYSIVQEYSAG